jgi:hypothetical protein
MQENTSQFLSEVMKQYGLFGVIVIIILLTTLIVIYKFGPQIYDTWKAKASDDHHKRMMHGIKKGPLVQSTLRNYLPLIKCDHIFVGEFHNGTSSIVGIPYMKFDIIFEHITPKLHENDCLLVRLYENEYVQTHDQLPGLLFQHNNIVYTLDELQCIDEQLYFRMKSRGVKVMAMSLIYNTKNIPVGIVGCFCFEEDTINMNELIKCSKEIENIYNK